MSPNVPPQSDSGTTSTNPVDPSSPGLTSARSTRRGPTAPSSTTSGPTTPGPRQFSPLSSAGSIWLIARRELSVHLRSKSSIITTAIMTVVLVGGLILVKYLGSPDPIALGYVSEAEAATTTVVSMIEAQDREVSSMQYSDLDALRSAVTAGDIDAGISLDDGLTLIVNEEADSTVLAAATNAKHSLAVAQAAAMLPANEGAELTAQLSSPVAVTVLNPPSDVDGSQVAVGFIVGFLLYLGIFGGGMAVAQGVVEEKSSRVIEILLASVRPWQLLAGKVIGIGLASIAQVATYVVAGVVTANILGLTDSFSFNILTVGLWVLVWFLIGYLVYALIFAALGALVSRQEDLGSVLPLPMTLVIAAYIIGVSVAPSDPDSTIVTIASYIPFTSPIVMPIRSAYNVASTTEVVISLVIGFVCIPLLLAITTKMYSNGVRRSGSKLKIKDVLKAS